MRRLVPSLALVFQLAWSTAVPILHAESESLWSQAAFERTHTADCVRIHDPAHSATCSAVSAASARVVRYTLPAVGHTLHLAAAQLVQRVADAGSFELHLARSPPLVH